MSIIAKKDVISLQEQPFFKNTYNLFRNSKRKRTDQVYPARAG